MLTIVGQRPFWPFVLHFGASGADETHGFWRGVGERVARSPRRTWIGTTALLIVCALGLLNFSNGLTQGSSFRDKAEAISAQDTIARPCRRARSLGRGPRPPRPRARARGA